LLEAERQAILDLRRRGGRPAWRHIERGLDLEALRLDS
jgi:hypothetical protein